MSKGRESLLRLRLDIIEYLTTHHLQSQGEAIDLVNEVDFVSLGEKHFDSIMHYTVEDWAEWLLSDK